MKKWLKGKIKMNEKIQKIKNNKVLKIIGNIIYTIVFIFIALILIIAVLQRTTNNEISLGGYRIFVVATGSMVPKYNVGDVLLSKEIAPENIKVGDDIVYKGKKGSFNDKVITHRVISIEKHDDGGYKIITKGVANEEQDPEIDETQVYGKIIYKIKTLSLLGKIVKNMYVFYFIIFIPLGIIIYQIIKTLFDKEDDEEDNDGENSKDN